MVRIPRLCWGAGKSSSTTKHASDGTLTAGRADSVGPPRERLHHPIPVHGRVVEAVRGDGLVLHVSADVVRILEHGTSAYRRCGGRGRWGSLEQKIAADALTYGPDQRADEIR